MLRPTWEGGLDKLSSCIGGRSTRRAAAYVDRILKGFDPGDPPIEQAAAIPFETNLTTAKTLGRTPILLANADEAVE